jgi:sugar lactone lactonase YvrE
VNANFVQPSALAVTPDGTIYVADTNNGRGDNVPLVITQAGRTSPAVMAVR